MKKLLVLLLSLQCSMYLLAETQPDFMVISDMHVMVTSLFDNGTAFTNYLQTEPKSVEYSQALMETAVDRIEAAKPKFLLVTGDLTKDGEKVSHEYVAGKFAELEAKGINVYVIPGNHDIANPNAKSYLGTSVSKVDNISADDFKTIYNSYGYDEAVMTNGLSYMVYPEDGLALICINSAKDNANTTRYSEGGITEELIQWIEKAAMKARMDGRHVVGMMHHQVMEHFDGEATAAPTYVTNNSDGYPALGTIQQRLVEAGISVMFTGHFHIQSISKTTTSAGELYDISTGSLSQYPSPIRSGKISSDGIISLTNQVIDTYHASEKTRSQITAAGLLSRMGYAAYSTYLLTPMTDILNCLMAGDETDQEPQKKVAAISTAAQNAELGLGQQASIGLLAQSIMYNYVGSATNVQPDNANSISCDNGNVRFVDGQDITNSLTDKNIYYSRAISNNWGTLVLPFAVKSNDDVQFYTLNSVSAGDNGVMSFTENNEEIPAYTPCVFKKKDSSADNISFSAQGISVDPSTSLLKAVTVAGTSQCTLTGTFINLTNQTGMYYIALDKFWKADDGISIKPLRAYFNITTSGNSAKMFTINIVDGNGVSGILSLDADGNVVDTPIYNLAGQQISVLQKGVNIIGGKKVVVK